MRWPTGIKRNLREATKPKKNVNDNAKDYMPNLRFLPDSFNSNVPQFVETVITAAENGRKKTHLTRQKAPIERIAVILDGFAPETAATIWTMMMEAYFQAGCRPVSELDDAKKYMREWLAGKALLPEIKAPLGGMGDLDFSYIKHAGGVDVNALHAMGIISIPDGTRKFISASLKEQMLLQEKQGAEVPKDSAELGCDKETWNRMVRHIRQSTNMAGAKVVEGEEFEALAAQGADVAWTADMLNQAGESMGGKPGAPRKRRR